MERIVIQYDEDSGMWEVFTLADLRSGVGGTAEGEKLARLLRRAKGLVIVDMCRAHVTRLRPVHELLRPWSEMEPEVVRAFAEALGVEAVEVVRSVAGSADGAGLPRAGRRVDDA